MRILHILEATQGGTRRHVLDLLPELQRRGAACDLVYSLLRYPPFENDAAWLRRQGIGATEIPMTRGPGGGRDLTALRALGAHLRAHRYDVIHCHSTKAGLLGRLAQLGAVRHVPTVYTPHCIAFDTALPRRERRAARLAEWLLAPLTAHFIAVSRHELHALHHAGIGAHGRASVIYNGIDLEAFDALLATAPPDDPAQRAPATPPPFTIGCFGRLTRQKNQAALVRALPLLLKEAPRARLLLVGSGEEEQAVRRLARARGVHEAIDWAGEVTEARPLYAQCDVVAQPSRWEGCPYSLLEAMAARRPVLTTPVGGVPEVITHDCGVIVQRTEPALLAHHLGALARDPAARATMGAAARQRVEQEFRLDQMVEQTLAVYVRVAR